MNMERIDSIFLNPAAARPNARPTSARCKGARPTDSPIPEPLARDVLPAAGAACPLLLKAANSQ